MEIEVGGQIQGISLGSFLQIVHMDRTTCTLKIYSDDNTVGYLFLTDGALIAAESGSVVGAEAAYEILSWNKTSIIIDSAAAPEKNIEMPLMSILMEGLRRKDEKNAQTSEVRSGGDVRTEIDVEFDPDSYVSKDDEIASQFVETEPASSSGDEIELDYGGSAPPPLDKPVEPSAPDTSVKKALPSEAFANFNEKEEQVSEKIPFEEEESDEEEVKVEFEGEDALLPERTAAGIAKKLIILTIILSAVTFAGLQFYKMSLLKQDYDNIIAKVQNQKTSTKMKQLLSSFINSRDDDDRYLIKAVAVLNKVDSLVRIEKKIKEMPIDDAYKEQAVKLYKDFSKKDNSNTFNNYVALKIKDLSSMLEKRDFKKLGIITSLPRDVRMKAYQEFLEKYPTSKYKQAVKNMIAAVGDEVYIELRREIKKCDSENNWAKCLQLSDNFIRTFSDDNRLEDIRTIRAKMKEKEGYADLKFRASAVDYRIAREMFVKYLKNNPDSMLKKEVRLEISYLNRKIDFKAKWTETQKYCTNTEVKLSQRLKELEDYIERDYSGLFAEESGALLKQLKIEEQQRRLKVYKYTKEKREKERLAKIQEEKDRIAKEKEDARLAELKRQKQEKRLKEESERMTRLLGETNTRFKVNPDRTVTDIQTGSVWCIIDSNIETGECFTYEQAREYVKNLRTGGYKDWRLPDTSELAVIYNRKPYFPSSGSEWYWTAEIIDEAMIDGGKSVIFYPDKKEVFNKIYLKFSNCGFVHAVRP